MPGFIDVSLKGSTQRRQSFDGVASYVRRNIIDQNFIYVDLCSKGSEDISGASKHTEPSQALIHFLPSTA
jgi:hypothetical protein